MRSARSFQAMRAAENYIFYTCLILALAISALGIAMDVAGR